MNPQLQLFQVVDLAAVKRVVKDAPIGRGEQPGTSLEVSVPSKISCMFLVWNPWPFSQAANWLRTDGV